MEIDWAKWVCPILLPISFIWDQIQYWSIIIGYYARFWGKSHEERVKSVQDQVIRWRTEGNGRKMCTARPSWMSVSQQVLGYKDKMYKVRIDLRNVLEIDTKKMVVHVEPMCTIGFLNRLLVQNGVTLPIVPELDFLTIGGLVMGGGIESTSHIHGLFQHICLEYELVTANGEVTIANLKENADLYHSVPFSYGTLGFLTRVTLKLTPYIPYLKLTYRPTYTVEDATEVLDREANRKSGNDSVEGIMFTENTAVIMTGEFVSEDKVEKDKINRMGLWYKPWFYRYVQTFLDKGETVEYVPTLHFHQRHNKPAFWLTHYWLPWAHNIVARFLLGWILPFNHQLMQFLKEKFVDKDFEDNVILQDFIIPIKNVKGALELSRDIVDVWPIWMVPCKLWHDWQPESLTPRAGKDVMYLDFGVYGLTFLPSFQGRDKTLRMFEKWTFENEGYQALYAETLMSYAEFCEMFPRGLYDSVRSRLPLCKEAFPETYEKVSREGRNAFNKKHK